MSSAENHLDRQTKVNRARESWIRRLIDLSRRNNLLYFRDLKLGTLDLSGYDPDAMAALLGGGATTLRRLLPHTDETLTAARFQEIRRRALANLEEKGLDTLFVALGMATWHPDDEGSPPAAAVLLLPISIEVKGQDSLSYSIQRAGEVQANLVLLHVLEEMGNGIDPDSLLASLNDPERIGEPDLDSVYRKLKDAARSLKDFEVRSRAVMGNFSYQKMAMVKDLREHAEAMAANDIIAAIAGDIGACESVQAAMQEINPREFDRISPDEEFLIRDADSSQQRVITAVQHGQHLVIQGPPGTGKSQTIANLIAVLSAQGKRVLFVAEKRAALEVVLRRLEESKLGHLALDLHGADITRRMVMSRVAATLAKVKESTPVDSQTAHTRFSERRQRLNEHVARIHCKRSPSGLSVFEMQGQLLRMSPGARASTRWRGQELTFLTAEQAVKVQDLLAEAGAHESLFLKTDPSPWTGANLPDGRSVQNATDLASRLHIEQWPALLQATREMCTAVGLAEAIKVEDVRAIVQLVCDAALTLSIYSDDLFRQDLPAHEIALQPAKRGGIASLAAWLFKSDYRNALKIARSTRREKSASSSQIYSEIKAAADQQRRWTTRAKGASSAQAFSGAEAARRSLSAFESDISALEKYLNSIEFDPMTLDECTSLLESLTLDTATPARMPQIVKIEREVASIGAARICSEIRGQRVEAVHWPNLFRFAWLHSCLDEARLEDPALAGFHGRSHESFVEEFCRLDKERLRLAGARVTRAHGERVIAVMNRFPEQTDLVRREANKRARHMPLRKLLAQAPDVLTALCPCWMASPLTVSQLLDASSRYFDVVIFDEASQVLPEDAAPSLLRASQAVVAGDSKQLPPTTFFAAGDSDSETEEEESSVMGFESLLDLLSAVVDQSYLEWHYRSKDERLIAFSNRHIYLDRMITFPSPGGPAAISHILVDSIPEDGQEESSSAEVRRVVDLILEHAECRPNETLGVIAMGIRHAQRVQGALDEALRLRPELEEFFDSSRDERFFVKNLERVQGDERDAIMLTVGYGKDRSGKLPYRFGPLNSEGGERRLNVAVTRARSRMTLVSSFSHLDMDPNRSTKRGVELLRLYLQFAASNGTIHGDTQSAHPIALNAFEADVFDTLGAQGITLMPQWGASRYRIDMVVQHPERPGRFVMAIECDGATYHSAPTARDRDRLRQQHLEALGWKFHRIWSTDWFMRRNEEIQRAMKSFEAAVERANRLDCADIPPPVTDSSEVDPEPQTAVQEPQSRGPCPIVCGGRQIYEYSQRELVELIKWIRSDGRLRTDQEVLDTVVLMLEFQRRGPRIKAEILAAIKKAERSAESARG